MTVSPVNDAPTANADTDTVPEDGTLLVSVLANDSDIDGDAVSISSFTQGTEGAVTQEGNDLRYTPNADFNGSDAFTYDISDGNGGTATGTVSMTVNPVNDAPTGSADSATVDYNGTLLISVLANDVDADGDAVSITSFTQGVAGTVAQEGDQLRYTPDSNVLGFDGFEYVISDGNGGVDTVAVSVSVEYSADLSWAAGNFDSWTIVVPADGTYSFITSPYGQATDTNITIFDSGWSTVAYNDDSNGTYAELPSVSLTAGTYYVEVHEVGDDAPLEYHMEMKQTP
jgi:hypothetical protein